MGAVGIYPLTVDNEQQYRPQESPANGYINEGAVDAGGILLGVVTGGQALSFMHHSFDTRLEDGKRKTEHISIVVSATWDSYTWRSTVVEDAVEYMMGWERAT